MSAKNVTDPKKSHLHRRQLLVNREVQFGIVVYSIFLACCVSLMNFVVQGAASGRLEEMLHLSEPVSRPMLFAINSISLVLIFIYGFRLTNRIAGPIYRMREHMKAVADGKNPPPLTFRTGDYFDDMIEPYNELLKARKTGNSRPES